MKKNILLSFIFASFLIKSSNLSATPILVRFFDLLNHDEIPILLDDSTITFGMLESHASNLTRIYFPKLFISLGHRLRELISADDYHMHELLKQSSSYCASTYGGLQEVRIIVLP